MFIFLRLVLAHFIGDYLLQTDAIHARKQKGLAGVSFHVLIVFLCLVISVWPYLNQSMMWLMLAFVGLSHLVQDWTKTVLLRNKDNIIFYIFDQIFHVAFIAWVFLTPVADFQPPASNNFIVSIYNNDTLIIYLISLLIATFSGFYLMICFRKDVLRRPYFYSALEKWYGMIERAAIVTLCFRGGIFYAGLPVVFILRILIAFFIQRKHPLPPEFLSKTEIALSWIIGLLTAILLK